jgi:hypothetical protein
VVNSNESEPFSNEMAEWTVQPQCFMAVAFVSTCSRISSAGPRISFTRLMDAIRCLSRWSMEFDITLQSFGLIYGLS